MPTLEEIKKITSEYIDHGYPIWIYPSIDIRDDFAAEIRDKAIKFLQWLSRDYCIVPKSVMDKLSIVYRAKVYNLVCLNKDDIEALFGKSLFEE